MILQYRHIMALITEKGRESGVDVWTRKTTDALGVPYPKSKGWVRELIGMEIDEKYYEKILAEKDLKS